MNTNPVFEKDIKRHTRSIKISWIICGCNIVLATIAITSFFGEGAAPGVMRAGSYSMPARCYMLMAYALFAMILIAVPAITGGSISMEREARTLDVLLTTSLSPWKIITGKLESALSVVFLLTFSTLPALALVLVFGGISIWDLFLLVGILLVTGIYIGSLGICCSVTFKRTTIATVMTYMFVLFFLVGTVAAPAMGLYVARLQESVQPEQASPGAGKIIYLFLLNPLISFVGLISQQVGDGHEINTICNQFGNYKNDFIVSHMVWFSVGVQMLLSALFLFIAGRKINPLRK
ncbi:ABC transporter permease [Novisyntrophococcus fermenticellae]|uniref:ABC transporter permease n=1 Tax=Novisyntrophococcus fermenticellae TaxID=2068655 RepID=UPI001E4D4F24|nr:ABC transporter permease [Novisyntrophococcus fermenticellae]